MKYLYWDFNAEKGDEIKVNFNVQANVMLLSPTEYSHYKAGRGYRYYGGHATQTPFTLNVPSTGLWYVVVNLGGGAGKLSASAELIKGKYRV